MKKIKLLLTAYARMSMIDRIIILQKRLAAHGGKK